eukprot:CAMPEP_0170586408 /NCGR_PEP_ID=MMETSP0224-20130122/9732_1 /TAXON_ID=285029 /ORGANISM="Togula jolla, Strain CCCM 725" /LENGTH=165 /DNA_ID=CAMNT_0010909959 /DNA_START=42 /DNA_END=539 /DNA_ORIENTATION=+
MKTDSLFPALPNRYREDLGVLGSSSSAARMQVTRATYLHNLRVCVRIMETPGRGGTSREHPSGSSLSCLAELNKVARVVRPSGDPWSGSAGEEPWHRHLRPLHPTDARSRPLEALMVVRGPHQALAGRRHGVRQLKGRSAVLGGGSPDLLRITFDEVLVIHRLRL